MRQRTYLNVILTINAILLTGLLWTQIASGPVFSSEADAMQRSSNGMTNAGEQRQHMIRLLEQINDRVEKSYNVLDGEMPVRVTNIDEIRVARSDSQD